MTDVDYMKKYVDICEKYQECVKEIRNLRTKNQGVKQFNKEELIWIEHFIEKAMRRRSTRQEHKVAMRLIDIIGLK